MSPYRLRAATQSAGAATLTLIVNIIKTFNITQLAMLFIWPLIYSTQKNEKWQKHLRQLANDSE